MSAAHAWCAHCPEAVEQVDADLWRHIRTRKASCDLYAEPMDPPRASVMAEPPACRPAHNDEPPR